MNSKIKISEIRRDGGVLCLDFTNTIHDRTVSPAQDYLGNYDDFIDWSTLASSLPIEFLKELRKNAGDRMDEASRIFNRALNIREFLFEVFSLLAHGKKPDDTHLTHLNTLISDALRHIRLKYSRGKFIEEWEFDTTNLELILWPIIKSSSELLLSGRFDRIKECPRCRWLFYDTSKNGKRRWCSMETCGSNDKALRYYYRKSKQGNK